MAEVPKLLLDTLDELGEEELKRFKWHLKSVNDYPHIPKSQLENADAEDTVDKMMQRYGRKDSMNVILDILKKMNQNNLAEQLRNFLRVSDLRIVLLGKTGAGKSATANTILGREAFKTVFSPTSVTRHCDEGTLEVDGSHITVIDTPGLNDTSLTKEVMKGEIERCIYMSVPGPHAFLLVIRLGRFTEEERNAVTWIQENFGKEALTYTMVLFTGGDQLEGRSIQEFLSECADLQRLIDSCGNRFHVFKNKEKEDRTQVTELLKKIETMVERNGGEHYTNEMYQEAQRKIEEEEERKRQEEERKTQEAEQKIREEEERKREEAVRMVREEEEMKRQENERMIREEEERKRVEAVRLVREEEEMKRQENERKIREEENKRQDNEKIIRQENERMIREEEERKRVEAVRLVREEEEMKRQENERQIREEEARKRKKIKKFWWKHLF